MFRICFLFVFFSFGCFLFKADQNHSISFYFWKTHFSLTDYEKQTLKKFHSQKIYLRFFDLDIVDNHIYPIGQVNISNVPDGVSIVPVIYITNRSLIGLSETNTKELAKKVLVKVEQIADNYNLSYNHVQFDCDWTDSTQKVYFLFLKEFRKLSNHTLYISSTIRLHQIKYREKTGVPPVDEGFLMFYNMGKIRSIPERNSIFNKEDASKYLGRIRDYPLPLSYILPIFSWIVHSRDGKIVDLLTKTEFNEFFSEQSVEKTSSPNVYIIKDSFLKSGKFFKTGDLIKLEKIEQKDLLEAARLLKESMKEVISEIIFFDLDEFNLKGITHETLEKTISIFH